MTKETEKIIDEITALREKYKEKWGISVFNTPSPCMISIDISLKQLKEILENIVNTGESITDGYTKYILKRKITIDDLIVVNKNFSRTRKLR